MPDTFPVDSIPLVIGNSHHLTNRLIALFISVLVALASGTLYLYGVYSPQFIEHVGLTTSDSATIAFSMTIGAGIGGLPAGLLIDKYGPMLSTRLGSILILISYYSVYRIFLDQHDNLFVICLCMGFVGFGSITCYISTLKASQANFPSNRGAAGALPVSAYGFAATIFSIVSATFFGDNTGGLIRFLAIFCGSVTFLGSFFIRIYMDDDEGEEQLTSFQDQSLDHPREQQELYGSFSFWGIGERTPQTSEASSLLEQGENTSYQSGPSLSQRNPPPPAKPRHSKKKQNMGLIQGIKQRIVDKLFLAHYLIVAITTGIGQNYIYSIGFIVTAQYFYKNNQDRKDSETVKLQALQVAIISISSFLGRLVGGFVSDILHRRKLQRLWIVIITIIIQFLGQLLLVLNVSNEILISISSAIMGSCYGLVFGTYPAVMADEFGTKSFSTNWGLICTGYVITLFILNKYFGWIYDNNSDQLTGHCYKGNGCYKGAFQLGMVLSTIAFIVTCIMMWKHRIRH